MVSNRIALITDSTCDIPMEWREKYDITVVPLTIIMGDRQYLDGVDLTAERFYELLPQTTRLPTTSQPAPREFLDAYKAAAEKGYQEAVVITISSAMSGTILSANQAAADSPIPVHVVDGKNNSMGLGWQVIAAARAREAGGDLEAMLKSAEQARVNMVYCITLDTLEYLAKGGRIGGATKFIGTILNIKPMINVNPHTGVVSAGSPSRSRARGIENLFKEFFNKIDTRFSMHITVLHNSALEDAQALAERVKREFSPEELFISITSPVLGIHTGPKALALVGYSVPEG